MLLTSHHSESLVIYSSTMDSTIFLLTICLLFFLLTICKPKQVKIIIGEYKRTVSVIINA